VGRCRLNKTAPEPSQYRELCRPERGEQPAYRLVRTWRQPALGVDHARPSDSGYPRFGRLYLSSTKRWQVHLVRGFDHTYGHSQEALVICAPLRSVRQGLSLYILPRFKEAPRFARLP
jgi:hypothetical protein